jgi:hypothetical protein
MSRSGSLPTPGTVPVSAFCQNCHVLHVLVGMLGQLVVQSATHSA